ncbi:transcriptional activator of glycolytic enzymes-domain-containing protein [Xylariaceae sp. FL1651]|nr:transcriptional activator of glycolytic enzymes-domain-containing protein [Xylariaceae sp. FL1651]
MCRTTRTVEELWREWTAGLHGQPSIASLDIRWGNRWRAGRRSEVQWYSLRLEVIKEIHRVAQTQRSSEEAMWVVHMQHRQQGCSLDQFCKRLRTDRKTRSLAI